MLFCVCCIIETVKTNNLFIARDRKQGDREINTAKTWKNVTENNDNKKNTKQNGVRKLALNAIFGDSSAGNGINNNGNNGNTGINNMNNNVNTTEIALSKPATTLIIKYQIPLRSRSRSRSRHKRHDYLNNISDKQPKFTKIKQPNHDQ